jgi:hypothetical protein
MGSHQRFQRFTVRRQNNHRIGGQPGASQLPVSASDSSCHGAADSTPVLLPESILAHTTFVPSRKAESQFPLGGTSRLRHSKTRMRNICPEAVRPMARRLQSQGLQPRPQRLRSMIAHDFLRPEF